MQKLINWNLSTCGQNIIKREIDEYLVIKNYVI